jgi:hypothetical protein
VSQLWGAPKSRTEGCVGEWKLSWHVVLKTSSKFSKVIFLGQCPHSVKVLGQVETATPVDGRRTVKKKKVFCGTHACSPSSLRG